MIQKAGPVNNVLAKFKLLLYTSVNPYPPKKVINNPANSQINILLYNLLSFYNINLKIFIKK